MSGQSIGGVIGAVVGSFIPGVGTQFGYAIGSYIGGYIDPTQVKGPRLSDASTQTSTVGGALPFGYGVFTTAGNVIWADELKEQVKRQRQGKGGTTKTTTYTYTRSYAVGVCEGPIAGYLFIKRNGKLVYTSDPNAPIADKDYSAKWLQRATLYYGGESQMPDSTIEAVVGAGEVSPFRGLAYIVVENDDLTDMAGAIPQYEFVVNATKPDVYAVSTPYPYYETGSASISSNADSAIILGLGVDPIIMLSASLDGSLRDIVSPYQSPEESTYVESECLNGYLYDLVRPYLASDDQSYVQSFATGGTLRTLIIPYNNYEPESVSISSETLDGEME